MSGNKLKPQSKWDKKSSPPNSSSMVSGGVGILLITRRYCQEGSLYSDWELLRAWPCLLKTSRNLGELKVILGGWAPVCLSTQACLEYCKSHAILKIIYLTAVWSGLVCFLGRFQSFRCCCHASLESILL